MSSFLMVSILSFSANLLIIFYPSGKIIQLFPLTSDLHSSMFKYEVSMNLKQNKIGMMVDQSHSNPGEDM